MMRGEIKQNGKKVTQYELRKSCPYCHKSDIKLMTQTEFYGREYSGAKLYVCQGCKARVGCHKGTEIAMGPLSDEELRGLRMQIHNIIDKQWETKRERTGLYRKLSERYDMQPFHVGFLNNEKARYVLYDLKENPITPPKP